MPNNQWEIFEKIYGRELAAKVKAMAKDHKESMADFIYNVSWHFADEIEWKLLAYFGLAKAPIILFRPNDRRNVCLIKNDKDDFIELAETIMKALNISKHTSLEYYISKCVTLFLNDFDRLFESIENGVARKRLWKTQRLRNLPTDSLRTLLNKVKKRIHYEFAEYLRSLPC